MLALAGVGTPMQSTRYSYSIKQTKAETKPKTKKATAMKNDVVAIIMGMGVQCMHIYQHPYRASIFMPNVFDRTTPAMDESAVIVNVKHLELEREAILA